MYGYTLLTPKTVYYILLLELTHGLTISLSWVTIVSYSRNISPLELRSTVFAIVTVVNTCLGSGGGAVLGGYIMEHRGGRYLYRGAALITAGMFVMHVAVVVVFKACGWRLHPKGTDHGDADADADADADTGTDTDTARVCSASATSLPLSHTPPLLDEDGVGSESPSSALHMLVVSSPQLFGAASPGTLVPAVPPVMADLG